MSIPKDPFILLSFINTKLRDEYSSMEDLCQSLKLERGYIEKILSSIDYSYSRELNRFTAMIE